MALRKDVKMLCPHCGWWNAAGVQTGYTPTVFYCFRCGRNIVQAKNQTVPQRTHSPRQLSNNSNAESFGVGTSIGLLAIIFMVMFAIIKATGVLQW